MNNIIYRLDKNDMIIDIEGEWDEFASENLADLTSTSKSSVLKTPLWKHLHGETREVYQYLVDSIKKKKNILSFPIRCDGPGIKRELKLTISSHKTEVVFESSVMKEEQRLINLELDIRTINCLGKGVFMCCFCNLVRFPGGDFMELEELVQEGLFQHDFSSVTRYSCICSSCDKKLSRLI